MNDAAALIWLLCAGCSAYVAAQKNRRAGNWFLLGLVFGIFALIAIAAVLALAHASPGDETTQTKALRGTEGPTGQGESGGIHERTWRCPRCSDLSSLEVFVCERFGY